MGRIDRRTDILELQRQRDAAVAGYFEPQLRTIGLSTAEIDGLDAAGLREALDRVNDAIGHPDQFGMVHLRVAAGLSVIITKVQGEAQIEIGVLPLLLERKQRILDRLRILIGEEQVTTLKELAAGVTDDNLRESIDRELSILERDARRLEIESQTAELQRRAEEQRLLSEIEHKRFEVAFPPRHMGRSRPRWCPQRTGLTIEVQIVEQRQRLAPIALSQLLLT